jgi:hypothetical protein
VEGDTVADVDPAAPLPRRPVADETPPPPPTRSGLTRRVPGTHLVEGVTGFGDVPITPRIERDPDAEREALNEYMSGFARGTSAADPEQPTQPTLAERHS